MISEFGLGFRVWGSYRGCGLGAGDLAGDWHVQIVTFGRILAHLGAADSIVLSGGGQVVDAGRVKLQQKASTLQAFGARLIVGGMWAVSICTFYQQADQASFNAALAALPASEQWRWT